MPSLRRYAAPGLGVSWHASPPLKRWAVICRPCRAYQRPRISQNQGNVGGHAARRLSVVGRQLSVKVKRPARPKEGRMGYPGHDRLSYFHPVRTERGQGWGTRRCGLSPALRLAARVVERGTLIEIVRNWKPYPGGPAGSDIVGGRDEKTHPAERKRDVPPAPNPWASVSDAGSFPKWESTKKFYRILLDSLPDEWQHFAKYRVRLSAISPGGEGCFVGWLGSVR